MASKTLTIHIPPEANPENVSSLVDLLARDQGRSFDTVQELLDVAAIQGVGTRTEMQFTATKLGLVERRREGIGISQDGLAMSVVRKESRGDILHFLMYSRWSEIDPLDFLPSWSYRTICDSLWKAQSVKLTDDYLDQQVEETINRAETTFTEIDIGYSGGVSFSRKSLTGLNNWLKGITPPVIEGNTFARRAFCLPELLLLAIGFVFRGEDTPTGIDILLSREKRDAICRVCLLEPNSLDRALDWMIPIFPAVIQPGTSAGFLRAFHPVA